MVYDIVKLKGSSQYGICFTDDPKKQPIDGIHGEKKKIMKICADKNGMTTKEFSKSRR